MAAQPASRRYPGVVFYSDIFQLTDSTLRWCMRLAGYRFVVAAPEIYRRIEPAGAMLEFDDEGERRGQADADATPVADFDEDIRAALDWLEADDRVAAGRSLRDRALHRWPPGLPRRVQLSRARTALWYPTGLHDGKLSREADAGSLGALRRSGRVATDLRHQRPHTPEGAARSSTGAGRTG